MFTDKLTKALIICNRWPRKDCVHVVCKHCLIFILLLFPWRVRLATGTSILISFVLTFPLSPSLEESFSLSTLNFLAKANSPCLQPLNKSASVSCKFEMFTFFSSLVCSNLFLLIYVLIYFLIASLWLIYIALVNHLWTLCNILNFQRIHKLTNERNTNEVQVLFSWDNGRKFSIIHTEELGSVDHED